jgi:hypothetical protein
MGRHETTVIMRLVSLVVPGYPALDADTRIAVHHDVTAFVGAQIDSMPSFLRLPYRLAIIAFNWLAVLRHGQPFLGLGDAAATSYLALWSSPGLGPSRDFVKLIRSCALLAYFDHPRVRSGLEAAAPAAAQRAIGNGLD